MKVQIIIPIGARIKTSCNNYFNRKVIKRNAYQINENLFKINTAQGTALVYATSKHQNQIEIV